MATPTKLKIITPNGIFFEGPTDIITVKTTEGEMGILHGKSPIVASLKISDLYIGKKTDGKECAVAGGLLYVTPTTVTIITDAIEYKKDIDLTRAEKAKAEAERTLKNQLDESEALKQKLALQRAINRISVKKGLY